MSIFCHLLRIEQIYSILISKTADRREERSDSLEQNMYKLQCSDSRRYEVLPELRHCCTDRHHSRPQQVLCGMWITCKCRSVLLRQMRKAAECGAARTGDCRSAGDPGFRREILCKLRISRKNRSDVLRQLRKVTGQAGALTAAGSDVKLADRPTSIL